MKFNKDGVILTADEARDAVDEYEYQTTYDEPGRWSRTAHVIVKMNGRFFGITYDQGLTEMQEDYFEDEDTYPEVFPYDEVEIKTVRKFSTSKPKKIQVLEQAKIVIDEAKLKTFVDTLDFEDLDGTLKLIKESQDKLKEFMFTGKLTKYNTVVTLYINELNELFAELKVLKNK